MQTHSQHQQQQQQRAASSNSDPTTTRSRKRKSADSLGRLDRSSTSAGRGCDAGWTRCPLCGDVSAKKFAMGRGIAMHLHTVHAPWKATKLQNKIRRRHHEAQARRDAKDRAAASRRASASFQPMRPWQPSQAEIDEWDARVCDVLKAMGGQDENGAKSGNAMQRDIDDDDASPAGSSPGPKRQKVQLEGPNVDMNYTNQKRKVDKNGNDATSYKASLPRFLQLAADGRIAELKALVKQTTDAILKQSHNDPTGVDNNGDETVNAVHAAFAMKQADSILQLLATEDRHRSTAEHWAAGGGHVDCLQYLMDLRRKHTTAASPSAQSKSTNMAVVTATKPNRRRDGKTPLHYAARNGRLECLKYLLRNADPPCDPNIRSGDGTTPLHMACYGGHLAAVSCLVDHGADIHARNDWDCSAAHWVAMTINKQHDEIWRLCRFLRQHGVAFTRKQTHGHSALHKAAQHRNAAVLSWMASNGGAGLSMEEKAEAGTPDKGGHTPSSIWESNGGDSDILEMLRSHGW